MRISITVVIGVLSLLIGGQVAVSQEAGGGAATPASWGNATPSGAAFGAAFSDGQAVYPRHPVTPRGWGFKGYQQNNCCDRCGHGWDTFCDEKRAICSRHLGHRCDRCGGAGSACHCAAAADCGTPADDCGVVDDACGCGQSSCCKGRCGFGVFRMFGLLQHGSCGCARTVTCGHEATSGCASNTDAGMIPQADVDTIDTIPPAPEMPDEPSA